MVTYLCDCKGEDYKPNRKAKPGEMGWEYVCENCNRELTFKKMDEYAWSIGIGVQKNENNK